MKKIFIALAALMILPLTACATMGGSIGSNRIFAQSGGSFDD